MRTGLEDTHPDIERVQFDMLRKMGAAGRVRLARSLTQSVMQMSWRALQRAHPDATGEQIELLFVAVNYGDELAKGLEAHSAVCKYKRMISNDILAAIRPFVEALERLGVDYYIGGSVASSAMGKPRSTLDVDIVADLQTKHVQALVAALEIDYYIVAAMLEDAIDHRSSFNIIYLKNSIKIDVFIPKHDAFAASEFRRRIPVALGEDEPVRTYEVASPEDTILRKLDWYKMGGAVSERQWLDVLGILKLNGAALDVSYMRSWAALLGLGDLLEKALEAAQLPTI